MINTFDIDGVINMGEYTGLRPQPNDIIITGRSIAEMEYTHKWLRSIGINNPVLFQKCRFEDKTREKSGKHKAASLNMLKSYGIEVGLHFEDDEVQARIIEEECPWVKVVRVVHNLVEKENVWHGPTNNEPGAESQ